MVKRRDSSISHGLFDIVRGARKLLYSDSTNVENQYGALHTFNSDGFRLTTGGEGNASGGSYVAWNWNAGDSTVTNTDGSRTSSVRANPTAGFSIVTYTGNGSSGATIGHGLGVAPQVIFVKTRTSPDHWAVYHHSIGNTKIIYLNLTNSQATSSGYWNNTTPSSSVFTVGNDNKTNKSGDNYVAYCFTGIPSYSSFGKYNGNGSSNGIYVNCGFKPALVIYKSILILITGSYMTTQEILLTQLINHYFQIQLLLNLLIEKLIFYQTDLNTEMRMVIQMKVVRTMFILRGRNLLSKMPMRGSI